MNIKFIDLSNMNLKKFPDWLKKIELKDAIINLEHNKIKHINNIKKELLKHNKICVSYNKLNYNYYYYCFNKKIYMFKLFNINTIYIKIILITDYKKILIAPSINTNKFIYNRDEEDYYHFIIKNIHKIKSAPDIKKYKYIYYPVAFSYRNKYGIL